jgi:hypothetical protein
MKQAIVALLLGLTVNGLKSKTRLQSFVNSISSAQLTAGPHSCEYAINEWKRNLTTDYTTV